MSVAPGTPGAPRPPEVAVGLAVSVHRGRRQVWGARLRAARQEGRARLTRVRHWLGSAQGRRAGTRAVQGFAAIGVVVGAGILLGRWVDRARTAAAACGAAARRVGHVVGMIGQVISGGLGLDWLARLLAGGLRLAPGRRHTRCQECRTRIRTEARVCYRCGAPRRPGERLARPPWPARALALSARLITLRLPRRCPECRRSVPSGARRCRSCGARLGRSRA